MTPLVRRAGLAVALLVATGACSRSGGSSGGGTAAEKQFVAAGNAICGDQVARAAGIPKARTAVELGTNVKRARAITEQEAAALRALSPTADARRDFNAMLADIDRIVASLQQAETAAGRRDRAAYDKAMAAGAKANRRAAGHASGAGLDKCVRQRARSPRR